MDVKQTKTPQQVTLRWSRLFCRLVDRRQWHDHGIWLWLLQRPGIRFLPCPYPNVKNCGDWKLQIESMKVQKVWPALHLTRAIQKVHPSLLAECLFLRDRLGFEMAYLEDPMVGNILMVRSMKGQKAAIQREAMKHTKAEAQLVAKSKEKEEAIRALVGPRGGLPSLKQDLVRLATLLHQPVEEKDTVEKLKQKIRGPLAAVMATMPNRDSRSRASQDAVTISSSQPVMPVMPQESPGSGSPDTKKIQEVEDRLMTAISRQDDKFRLMFQQLMTHLSNGPQPSMTGVAPSSLVSSVVSSMAAEDMELEEMSKEEVRRLSIEHRQELRHERMVAQHGEHYQQGWGDLI